MGVVIGFKWVGLIIVVFNEECKEEIYCQVVMVCVFGVEVEEISNECVVEMYLYLNLEDVKGVVYLLFDG